MKLIEKLQQGILLLDGGMGTMLQKRGLGSGEIPELLTITHPETVLEIHQEYVAAGADIVTTNTFQANDFKLPSSYSVERIINAAVTLAKKSGAPFVGLDIGPLGQLYQPLGTMTFQEAYDQFSLQARTGEKAGADCIIIETFGDLYEAKIAVLAAKENTSLPVFCTLTFEKNGRTFMGTDPITALLTLQDMGIVAFGANCSLGPAELLPLFESMQKHATIPLMIQANAGLPNVTPEGKTLYTITPVEFSHAMKNMLDLGVTAMGSCCGTTPAFTEQLNLLRKEYAPKASTVSPTPVLTTSLQHLFLSKDTVFMGKAFSDSTLEQAQNAAKEKDGYFFSDIVLAQVDSGAAVVQLSLEFLTEDTLPFLPALIAEVQSMSPIPLAFSASAPEVLELATRVYSGRALLMPQNQDLQTLQNTLLSAKNIGAVVALPLPFSEAQEELFSATKHLLSIAQEVRFPRHSLALSLPLPSLENIQGLGKLLQQVSEAYQLPIILSPAFESQKEELLAFGKAHDISLVLTDVTK